MRELIKEDEILKNFTFHYDDTKNDTDLFFFFFFHIIKQDRKVVATEMKISIQEGADINDFTNLFDENAMARFSLKCTSCGTDYSLELYKNVIKNFSKRIVFRKMI